METLKWEKILKKRPYMSQDHQVYLTFKMLRENSDWEQKNRKQKNNWQIINK